MTPEELAFQAYATTPAPPMTEGQALWLIVAVVLAILACWLGIQD